MVIEVVYKAGPFQDRPLWVEVAVQAIFVAILLLIAQVVAPLTPVVSIAIWISVTATSVFFVVARRRNGPRTSQVAITDAQADTVRAKIGDGTDTKTASEAIHFLRSEGMTRLNAEMAVTHFLNQVNPASLRRMTPFFETREIGEAPNP